MCSKQCEPGVDDSTYTKQSQYAVHYESPSKGDGQPRGSEVHNTAFFSWETSMAVAVSEKIDDDDAHRFDPNQVRCDISSG